MYWLQFLCRVAALCALTAAMPAPAAEIQACFTPPVAGACDPMVIVVQTIRGARTTIRLQMYSLTLQEVVSALIKAKRRGIDVRVIADRSQLQQDRNVSLRVTELASAGVPVLVDSVPGLMHNKVMIVDGETVLTGSFNYTWGAEHWNAENLLVLHDPELAAEYLQNWNQRAAQSRPFIVRATGTPGPVAGNRRSMIYQSQGCRYYDKISPRNRIMFPDAQAAEAAGYRPAKDCR